MEIEEITNLLLLLALSHISSRQFDLLGEASEPSFRPTVCLPRIVTANKDWQSGIRTFKKSRISATPKGWLINPNYETLNVNSNSEEERNWCEGSVQALDQRHFDVSSCQT